MARGKRRPVLKDNTPGELERAVKEAEAVLVRPKIAGERKRLQVNQIKLRPELFQPRWSPLTGRDTDRKHVQKLKGAISTQGELEPILVIKLGKDWVCVDGHHRIEAYMQTKGWGTEVECEWFSGTVWEAVETSFRQNGIVKLETKSRDKWEASWKLVNLGRGSANQQRRISGSSLRLIGYQRALKRRYDEDYEFRMEFQRKLGPLSEVTWERARDTLHNIEAKGRDIDEEAETLARLIYNRIEDRLSRNPAVTARALAKYDTDLIRPLLEELQTLIAELEGGTAEETTEDASPEPGGEPGEMAF